MSWNDIIIFFVSIFLCFYSVIFVNTTIESGTNRANNLYAHYVASACQDALALNTLNGVEVRDNLQDNRENVWNDITVREKTVRTFYKSFGLCLNKDGDGFYNEMELMTPIVCLVDVDGYYISYNAAYDSNSSSHNDYDNLHNISALNTWSEKRENYIVRYYLSDNVQIIREDGTMIEGDRKEVYQEIGDPILDYLVNKEIFEESKNACIVQTLSDQINYYVNAINNNADAYDTQYIINLPEISGETWCGLVNEPAICAFVQGNTYNIRNKKASVYGFGIYELSEPLHYFILEDGTGVKTYYCYEEQDYFGKITEIEPHPYYNGYAIEELYNSKKDCAKEDAYPSYN